MHSIHEVEFVFPCEQPNKTAIRFQPIHIPSSNWIQLIALVDNQKHQHEVLSASSGSTYEVVSQFFKSHVVAVTTHKPYDSFMFSFFALSGSIS